MYPSQKPIAHFSFSTILLLTACFMLTVSFFLTGSVNAQTEVTGAIEGRVTNSQKPNEPVPNATVQIINLESQVQTATRTDADGRFVKNQLPPGRYKVIVKADKFQTKEIDRVQPIDVELTNKAVPIPISLDPSSLATATPSPSPTEPSQPGVTPTPSPSASPSTTGGTVATRGKTVEEDSDIRNEINTTDGRRGGGYREKEVSTLPLG
jgi:cell division protein FtsN